MTAVMPGDCNQVMPGMSLAPLMFGTVPQVTMMAMPAVMCKDAVAHQMPPTAAACSTVTMPAAAVPMVLPAEILSAMPAFPAKCGRVHTIPPGVPGVSMHVSPVESPPFVVGMQLPCQLPIGGQHRFHEETRVMGWLSDDGRQFTKMQYKGRLSILTENVVHSSGLVQYALQFTAGNLSSADGVGFIFSSKLPCSKNIQRIASIFVNSAGRICLRAGAEVVRSNMSLQPLKVGDWIWLSVDFNDQISCFKLIPADGGAPSSVTFAFGSSLEKLKTTTTIIPDILSGYFACVVKNLGVTVTLSS